MAVQANAVLYGIGSGLETRPNFLKQQHWRLVSSIAKEKPEEVCSYLRFRYDMCTMLQVQNCKKQSSCREKSMSM